MNRVCEKCNHKNTEKCTSCTDFEFYTIQQVETFEEFMNRFYKELDNEEDSK